MDGVYMAKKDKKKPIENHIIAIVTTDTNYGMSKDGLSLFNIPDDIKHFSRAIVNGYIIMGKATYDNLQKGALPKGTIIVVTHNSKTTMDNLDPTEPNFVSMENVQKWLLSQKEKKTNEKISVIGGGQIFEALLPYCEYIYITKVFKAAECIDLHFPNLDKMQTIWDMCYASDVTEYNGIKYQYRRYKNTKPVKPEKVKKK